MFRRVPLNLNHLSQLEDKFLRFSHVSGQDVQKIWRKTDEPELKDEELEKLEYQWSNPLWTKMFFRLKKEGYACNLWGGCDPNNRQRLLSYFKLSSESQYVEFFHWMRNTLSVVDICYLEKGKIDDVKELDQSEHAKLWRKNEIVYFYFLPKQKQEALVHRYNEEVIRPFLEESIEFNGDDLWMFGKEYDISN